MVRKGMHVYWDERLWTGTEGRSKVFGKVISDVDTEDAVTVAVWEKPGYPATLIYISANLLTEDTERTRELKR